VSHAFGRLGRAALAGLADALKSGRLGPPYPRSVVAQHVPEDQVESVCAALVELAADGMAARHIARALTLLAEERSTQQRMEDRVQLVWSPPEFDRVDARDTGVVVQDLFRLATRHVVIASYALDEGPKAQGLFGELAERMDAQPELEVRIYANIHRRHGDDTPSVTLVRHFAQRMRDHTWPGQRLPQVYYDPRSLEIDGKQRAVLHAKCVVVDQRWTLLTSANFTEAAREKNIEAGLLLDDLRLARRVTRQFDALIEAGALRPLSM